MASSKYTGEFKIKKEPIPEAVGPTVRPMRVKKHWRRNSIPLDEMFGLRISGWTYSALARKYNVDHTTILHHCKKWGIEPNQKSPVPVTMKQPVTKEKKPKTYDFDIKAMLIDRAGGQPFSKLERWYRKDSASLRYVCKKFGIEPGKAITGAVLDLPDFQPPTGSVATHPQAGLYDRLYGREEINPGKDYAEYLEEAKARATARPVAMRSVNLPDNYMQIPRDPKNRYRGHSPSRGKRGRVPTEALEIDD